MTADANPSLSEALTKFVAVKKNGKGVKLDHRELSRFIAWFGRERNVIEVTPAEVADYAQYVGLGGLESAQRLTRSKLSWGIGKTKGGFRTAWRHICGFLEAGGVAVSRWAQRTGRNAAAS